MQTVVTERCIESLKHTSSVVQCLTVAVNMETLLRVFLWTLKVLSWILYPIFYLLRLEKKEKSAPITNQILLFSGSVLAEKIRKRELQSVTIVTAYITRIKEVNQLLNAVVEDRFTEALEEAKNIDEYLKKTIHSKKDLEQLKTNKPLLGVPVTIKESCGVKGMSQSVGSLSHYGFRAATDGKAVSSIRQAGGIILLVSNTPELCLYWESNNKITGRTNNPYNGHYSVGGSSGGEGALVGAGASVLGIGSDAAGSLRMPALLNGVFCHKGSANLVDTKGHYPVAPNNICKFNLVIGPLVRYAEDLPLTFKLLVNNPKYIKLLNLDEHVDLKALKIYHMLDVSPSNAFVPVDAHIKTAINKCVAHLQHVCGCSVDQFKFNMSNAMEITVAAFMYMEDLPNILNNPITKQQSDWLILEFLKQLFGCSKYSFNGLVFTFINQVKGFILPHRKQIYEEELENLKKEFEKHLGSDGVLIYPTFSTNAYPHNQFIFNISGLQYQSIFNNLGLPCTNVPLGLDSHGMPIGVQVIAGRNMDRLCFAVAKELEKAFGGWHPPT